MRYDDINSADENLCIDSARSFGFGDGTGSAAFVTYIMVIVIGSNAAKDRLSRSSWYRHQKVLKRAGLLQGRNALVMLCDLPTNRAAKRERSSSRIARLIHHRNHGEVTA